MPRCKIASCCCLAPHSLNRSAPKVLNKKGLSQQRLFNARSLIHDNGYQRLLLEHPHESVQVHVHLGKRHPSHNHGAIQSCPVSPQRPCAGQNLEKHVQASSSWYLSQCLPQETPRHPWLSSHNTDTWIIPTCHLPHHVCSYCQQFGKKYVGKHTPII